MARREPQFDHKTTRVSVGAAGFAVHIANAWPNGVTSGRNGRFGARREGAADGR